MKKIVTICAITTMLVSFEVHAIDDMPDLGDGKGEPVIIEQYHPEQPPTPNFISKKQAQLNDKERRATQLASEWINRNDMPTRGHDGSVVFNYGATLPTVVCAPLYPCNLLLEPNEEVNQIDVGDPVRWKVKPSEFGEGDSKTMAIVVKPSDSNLTSALSIATNRRLYVVKLVSRLNDWMPKVSFAYPEQVDEAWDKYHAEKKHYDETVTMSDGVRSDNLNFNYDLTGDSPIWKPVRVYDDGQKTYIEFPKEMQFNEAPALVALSGEESFWDEPKTELVNYRIKGNRYVADKVMQTFSLIMGVGDEQVSVVITRK